MKKCKQCGTESSDSTKLCSKCGNNISKSSNYEQLKLDKSTKKALYIMGAMLIVIIALMASCSNGSKDKVAENSPSSIENAQNQDSLASEINNAEVDETAKDVAVVLDNQIFSLVTDSDNVTATLQQGINEFSQSQITALELYDLAKSAKDTQFSLWSQLSDLDTEENKDYVEAAEYHVINGQTIAENLMKYLDKQEMKYLSETKSALENSSACALSVVTKRMEYLSSQGFSDEEINKILSPNSN